MYLVHFFKILVHVLDVQQFPSGLSSKCKDHFVSYPFGIFLDSFYLIIPLALFAYFNPQNLYEFK
jgi:hypothetical protein